jgi:hypothetical protein
MGHPITPPPELRAQWKKEAPKHYYRDCGFDREEWIMDRAAQWSSNQELEACCEWAKQFNYDDEYYEDKLRAARRPKPPSLKEKALAALEADPKDGAMIMIDAEQLNTIRRALEALPNA